jgi:hypothetical protein
MRANNAAAAFLAMATFVNADAFAIAPMSSSPSINKCGGGSKKILPSSSTTLTRTRAGGDATAPSPLNFALAMSGGGGGGGDGAIAVEGTATISNEVFNLIKGIIGAGVLSLPAGK